MIVLHLFIIFFFFFNDTATTEIYTLSLHDALPISPRRHPAGRYRYESFPRQSSAGGFPGRSFTRRDRKSTRLNSSHSQISYAVFCLKKKKTIDYTCDHYSRATLFPFIQRLTAVQQH